MFLSVASLAEIRRGVEFAATAQVHGLTLVTRNIQDFQKLGIPLMDPWHPEGTQ